MNNIPKHVAIIMDGNGRWAVQKKRPRSAGHQEGAKVVEKIIQHALDRNIKYLSLFALSLDNLKRPQRELNSLTALLISYLQKQSASLSDKHVRLNVIGDKSKLTTQLKEKIAAAEDNTQYNTRLVLTIALYYTGRFDILQAAKRLAHSVKMNYLTLDSIDEVTFENALLTHALPAPDLLIRTSGEQRLSNFMLWDCAYTEFYFTGVLWPDFTKGVFDQALEVFEKRNRRFGHVKS
jgi:undecaprenyl diphosphate synthase